MAKKFSKVSLSKMAKNTRRDPSISLQAQMAEKILWVSNVKKDYESVEATNHLINVRLEKNDLEVVLPKIKANMSITFVDSFAVYRFGETKTKKQVILYLHGGAYISQPIRQHWKFVDFVYSKTKIPVVLPIYPKGPKYNYLDCYEMITEVYQDLISEGFEEIILMGDSAGAGLALSFTMKLKKDLTKLPSKLILLSPWVDLTMENEEIINYEKVDPMLSALGLRLIGETWANKTDLKNYLLSPIFGDLNDLPPISLFIGTHEIFLPDVKLLKNKLVDVKNDVKYFEYKLMNHVFPLYPIPEANFAKKEIIKLIKK